MFSLLDLFPRGFMAAQFRRPSGRFGRVIIGPLLNRSNARENQYVLASLQLAADDRVLEVGFGGGELIAGMLSALPHGHVSGADFSSEMVGFCSKRFTQEIAAGTVDLRQAVIEDLPFPEASFDKVCTVNTLYFWQQPEAAAAELFRVLATGGRLVVGFAPRAMLERLPWPRHGFKLYEAEEVAALLSQAGFTYMETLELEEPEGTFLCAVAAKP
jgi:ubiquinone/menaquinone biosynthesis C-methylase UbiE